MNKPPRKPRKPNDLEESLKRFTQTGAGEVEAGAAEDDDQRVRLVGSENSAHPLLIYSTRDGVTVELPFRNGTLWATQKQMADMFAVQLPAISKHLKSIYADGELEEVSTLSNMESVGSTGQKYSSNLYNLNALISVGYRIESKAGTAFRIWATDKLVQILTKGFYVDKERLMNQGEPSALDEFRKTAREIRTSIRNSYREVLGLCTLCSDYDGRSETARSFFMAMENKLLWAAADKTAPQLILERADAGQPDMGLTYYAGKRGPRQSDVVIGNNYLASGEQERKGRITEMWLTYVEEQLEQGRLPTMQAVEEKLDGFIRFNQWRLLQGKGRHSRDAANNHALEQLDLYRDRVKSEAEAGNLSKAGKKGRESPA